MNQPLVIPQFHLRLFPFHNLLLHFICISACPTQHLLFPRKAHELEEIEEQSNEVLSTTRLSWSRLSLLELIATMEHSSSFWIIQRLELDTGT